jgi:3-oxoacyl-[acyl-carrier-protein] synthase-1
VAESLHVTCLGLVCPVGYTPQSASAAMRAGISAFAELPFLDHTGEPVIGARVPDVGPDVGGRTRLTALLRLAMADTIGKLRDIGNVNDIPLLFCTANTSGSENSFGGMVSKVEQSFGVRFRRDGSAHIPNGAVAPFQALSRARNLLRGGTVPMCLIAAVDSLIRAENLKGLQAAGRLKSSAESDGIIPGEAAAVLLVAHRPIVEPMMEVSGVGLGWERATIQNDGPLLGSGLSAAVAAALGEAGLSMGDIDFRLSDVAGENYAFEELTLAQARLMRQTRDSQPLWHPAAFAGDCGAASGLLQLALAEQAFARHFAPGRFGLAHGSDPAGARAAAVLEGAEGLYGR